MLFSLVLCALVAEVGWSALSFVKRRVSWLCDSATCRCLRAVLWDGTHHRIHHTVAVYSHVQASVIPSPQRLDSIKSRSVSTEDTLQPRVGRYSSKTAYSPTEFSASPCSTSADSEGIDLSPEHCPRGSGIRSLRGLRRSTRAPSDVSTAPPAVKTHMVGSVISDVEDVSPAQKTVSPLLRVRLSAMHEHSPPATLSPLTLSAHGCSPTSSGDEIDHAMQSVAARASIGSRKGSRPRGHSLLSPQPPDAPPLDAPLAPLSTTAMGAGRFSFAETGGSILMSRTLSGTRDASVSPSLVAKSSCLTPRGTSSMNTSQRSPLMKADSPMLASLRQQSTDTSPGSSPHPPSRKLSALAQ